MRNKIVSIKLYTVHTFNHIQMLQEHHKYELSTIDFRATKNVLKNKLRKRIGNAEYLRRK